MAKSGAPARPTRCLCACAGLRSGSRATPSGQVARSPHAPGWRAAASRCNFCRDGLPAPACRHPRGRRSRRPPLAIHPCASHQVSGPLSSSCKQATWRQGLLQAEALPGRLSGTAKNGHLEDAKITGESFLVLGAPQPGQARAPQHLHSYVRLFRRPGRHLRAARARQTA